MTESNKCSRSDFFKGAGVMAGAAAMAGGSVHAAESADDTRPALRRMGKTDLMLPVVSQGTTGAQEPNLLKYSIDQGMNFIHTSTTYKGGRSIEKVAEAIKGQREKVILGIKITWKPDDDAAMDDALAQLGVDDVDIAFFNIHKADKVDNSEYRRAADRWREAGKFKYIGLTTHGDVVDCMKAALKQGFYDALMPAYNLSLEDEFRDVFKQAEDEGVGIVLMKTNREISDYYEAVPQYLATPGVTTICRTTTSFPMVRQMIEASKQKADPQAGLRLRERARLTMQGHCTMCGACTKNCPLGLEVADVVRCSDYYLQNSVFVDTAFETYRALSHVPTQSVCGSCTVCEQSCRNGVPVVHHIRRAESMLA